MPWLAGQPVGFIEGNGRHQGLNKHHELAQRVCDNDGSHEFLVFLIFLIFFLIFFIFLIFLISMTRITFGVMWADQPPSRTRPIA
ncbi:hypothetical protein K504DRAFT_508231 [Pleomassaria siparia CBS 279.74]|uniref:Uncharacterized protein n=1 Tax=Pleomassaria siparia CBS 279.74 TaxID=1314801 RepID=A0A6G1JT33_9PLEO|nr:hypothetical protein K504DRAFT_508231 [Pleomassaria siparia CBS 279.74]